jgi:hypothetical protein
MYASLLLPAPDGDDEDYGCTCCFRFFKCQAIHHRLLTMQGSTSWETVPKGIDMVCVVYG